MHVVNYATKHLRIKNTDRIGLRESCLNVRSHLILFYFFFTKLIYEGVYEERN